MYRVHFNQIGKKKKILSLKRRYFFRIVDYIHLLILNIYYWKLKKIKHSQEWNLFFQSTKCTVLKNSCNLSIHPLCPLRLNLSMSIYHCGQLLPVSQSRGNPLAVCFPLIDCHLLRGKTCPRGCSVLKLGYMLEWMWW